MRAIGKNIGIVGAGITGLVNAWHLQKKGYNCTVFEKADTSLSSAASYVAGGMLSPYCELESAELAICELGEESLNIWPSIIADLPDDVYMQKAGTLVVAHAQDRLQLQRLQRRITENGQSNHLRTVGRDEIAELEPALAHRFKSGLFIKDEGQIDPRRLLPALYKTLLDQGVTFYFNTDVSNIKTGSVIVDGLAHTFDWVIDCRGLQARESLPDLRGVKGEIAIIKTEEITLNRMIRLMHPRYPLYIVPRADNQFLIGATSIESEDRRGVSVRSAMELLSAAYSLHPAFGEATVVELSHHLRPAFPNNLPRIHMEDRLLRVNGLYRHGYLLSPSIAEKVSTFIETGNISNKHAHLMEACDDYHP